MMAGRARNGRRSITSRYSSRAMNAESPGFPFLYSRDKFPRVKERERVEVPFDAPHQDRHILRPFPDVTLCAHSNRRALNEKVAAERVDRLPQGGNHFNRRRVVRLNPYPNHADAQMSHGTCALAD